MKRRNFLSWMGLGWLVTVVPSIIAACASNQSTSNTAANPARADGFVVVGTVADLDKNGKILHKQVASTPVLVIRNPANPNTLNAVNPTCPHRDCLVLWKAEQKEFICPCHSSKFTPDGQLIEGSSKKPLATYQAKIEGNSVLVKVS